jgi:hypothetical protein
MAEKAILAASDGGQDFLRSSHLQKFNVSSWRDLISDSVTVPVLDCTP